MANFFKAQTKKQTVSATVIATIKRIDLNGNGVAQWKNKPLFVAGALLEEEVEIKIVEQKSKYARGHLLNVIKPSVQRIQPLCAHYKSCGGCDLQHLQFDQHIAFKENKVSQLLQRSDLVPPFPWQSPILSEPWHYRRKARIGVQYNKKGQVTLGFRQKSTNDLVSVKECPVLLKPINILFKPLKQVLNGLSLSQSIGHVEVICSESSNDKRVTLVTLLIRQLKAINKKDKLLWQQAASDNGWQIYLDQGDDNLVAITEVQPLTFTLGSDIVGVDNLGDRLANEELTLNKSTTSMALSPVEITFTAKDFIQVNPAVNRKMVAQAISWLALKSTDNVLDLFCGLGNFTLPIAQHVQHVIGVEGIQKMVDNATENAVNNKIDNVDFYQADLNSPWKTQPWAASFFHDIEQGNKTSINKLILDPARAGAYQAIEQLLPLKIQQILYISCDPTSLAKDITLLNSAGYTLDKIGLMDLFAQTKHVETMALFTLTS